MQECVRKSCIFAQNKRKDQSFLTDLLELMTRFELVTSSLPRMRSTD